MPRSALLFGLELPGAQRASWPLLLDAGPAELARPLRVGIESWRVVELESWRVAAADRCRWPGAETAPHCDGMSAARLTVTAARNTIATRRTGRSRARKRPSQINVCSYVCSGRRAAPQISSARRRPGRTRAEDLSPAGQMEGGRVIAPNLTGPPIWARGAPQIQSARL
jgi:hypothetical protein